MQGDKYQCTFFAGGVSWQIAILHDFSLIAPSSVAHARQKSRWPSNTMAAVSRIALRRRYPCTPWSVPSQQNFAREVQKYMLPGIAWRLCMYALWRVSIATTSPRDPNLFFTRRLICPSPSPAPPPVHSASFVPCTPGTGFTAHGALAACRPTGNAAEPASGQDDICRRRYHERAAGKCGPAVSRASSAVLMSEAFRLARPRLH